MWLFNRKECLVEKALVIEKKWANSYPLKNPTRAYKKTNQFPLEASIVINRRSFVKRGNFISCFFQDLKENEVIYSKRDGWLATKSKKVLEKIIENELKRTFCKIKTSKKFNKSKIDHAKKISNLLIYFKKTKRW